MTSRVECMVQNCISYHLVDWARLLMFPDFIKIKLETNVFEINVMKLILAQAYTSNRNFTFTAKQWRIETSWYFLFNGIHYFHCLLTNSLRTGIQHTVNIQQLFVKFQVIYDLQVPSYKILYPSLVSQLHVDILNAFLNHLFFKSWFSWLQNMLVCVCLGGL